MNKGLGSGAGQDAGPSEKAAGTVDMGLKAAIKLQVSGDLAGAEKAYRDILACSHMVDSNLAVICLASGRLDEGIELLRSALEQKPDYAEALNNLGLALFEKGELDDAITACQKAVDLQPNYHDALTNLAFALKRRGKLGEATPYFDRAVALNPNHPGEIANLGTALLEEGRHVEAAEQFRRALALSPTFAAPHTDLLLSLNYHPGIDDETLLAEHLAWDAQHGVPRRRDAKHTNERAPEKRLRIGYVAGNLRHHPQGFFAAPLLAAHDRSGFEIICYVDNRKEDELTALLKSYGHLWRSTRGMPDAQLARLIQDDGIDILVDLEGHCFPCRLTLFAMKPAPVQVSWLGYVATTGLSAMDYVFMDEHTVPQGLERFFAERVHRLPSLRFCYLPPEYAPEPAGPPLLHRGYPTFGSFNNLTKVTPDVVRLWSDILKAVPESRLLLKWWTLGSPVLRERILGLFADNGIDVDRVELRSHSSHPDMLAEYGDIDIALDPFPFSGGLTSFEALWMGVPIVTMPGTRAASRQTHGMLAVLGLDWLSCRDRAHYVSTAARLARDVGALTKLHAELRGRMASSALCDGPAFAHNIESAYREIWRTWCRTQHADSATREV